MILVNMFTILSYYLCCQSRKLLQSIYNIQHVSSVFSLYPYHLLTNFVKIDMLI